MIPLLRFRIRRLASPLAGVVCLAVAVPTAFASAGGWQERAPEVRLAGRVLERESGQPIPGADLTLAGTSYAAMTDERGDFAFRSIPPGLYVLKVSSIGRQDLTRKDVRITSDATAWVEITLEARPIMLPFEVRVQGEAPSRAAEEEGALILSAESIRRSGARDVAEALALLPGVFVRDEGSAGACRTVSVRGADPHQVLVLLDGMELNGPGVGGVDLSAIPLELVEEIEVLPGARSARYGAGALGGMVEIRTRRPGGPPRGEEGLGRKELGGEAHAGDGEVEDGEVDDGEFCGEGRLIAERGSFGQSGARLSFDGKAAGFGLLASAGREWSRGDFAFTDPDGLARRRENAWSRRESLFLKWAAALGGRGSGAGRRSEHLLRSQAGLEVEGMLDLSRTKRGMPGALEELSRDAWGEERRLVATLGVGGAGAPGGRAPGGRPTSAPVARGKRAMLGYLESEAAYSSSDPYPLDSRYRTRVVKGETEFEMHAGEHWSAGGGVSVRGEEIDGRDRLRSELSLGRHRRGFAGAYATARVGLMRATEEGGGEVHLHPSLRWDSVSPGERELSPAVALTGSRPLGPGRGNARLAWGLAYRPPALTDLFWTEDVFSVGNPDLRPERGQTRELGVGLQLPLGGRLSAGGSVFAHEVRDIIVWRRSSFGKYSPVNVARAQVDGWEANFNWESPARVLSLRGSYSQETAVNHSGEPTTDGRFLPFRPLYQGELGLRAGRGAWWGDLHRRWVGRRYTREANTKSLDPYAVADLSVGSEVGRGRARLEVILSVTNVMNASYQVLERYPMPGRAWDVRLVLKGAGAGGESHRKGE